MMDRKLNRRPPVIRFRADFKSLVRFEKRTQAAPDDRMIVG